MAGPVIDDKIVASHMMDDIRKKVARMKSEGCDVSDMDDILFTGDANPMASMPASENIDYLLKNWSVQNDYRIFSHRKLIGAPLVFGRKMVNGEINRNVGPLTDRQNRLNQVTAGVLLSHDNDIGDLSERVSTIETTYRDLTGMTKDIKASVRSHARIMEHISDVNVRLDKIVQAIGLQNEDFNAKAFADTFGGSEDNIKEIYGMFIKYYENRKNVLDIGCGRGYFLDLAEAGSIKAYGIDLSADAVRECVNKGRKAKYADALAHLIETEDSGLDGAFIAHVVEHLSQDYLTGLIRLLGKRLQPGAPLVIITPNIMNIAVSACSFYIDPTHRTHIHPDYLELLLRSNGFEIVEKKWYQPTIPESIKLQKLSSEGMPENLTATVERLNENIDKLNAMMYGDRDFAIVARRSS